MFAGDRFRYNLVYQPQAARQVREPYDRILGHSIGENKRPESGIISPMEETTLGRFETPTESLSNVVIRRAIAVQIFSVIALPGVDARHEPLIVACARQAAASQYVLNESDIVGCRRQERPRGMRRLEAALWHGFSFPFVTL